MGEITWNALTCVDYSKLGEVITPEEALVSTAQIEDAQMRISVQMFLLTKVKFRSGLVNMISTLYEAFEETPPPKVQRKKAKKEKAASSPSSTSGTLVSSTTSAVSSISHDVSTTWGNAWTPRIHYEEKGGNRHGSEPHRMGISYVNESGMLFDSTLICSRYQVKSLLNDEGYKGAHPCTNARRTNNDLVNDGVLKNKFPSGQIGAPKYLSIQQYHDGGPMAQFRLRDCHIVNLNNPRDGGTCHQHPNGCGKSLSLGELVVIDAKEDVHMVQHETYYMGAYRVVIHPDHFSKGCRVGVVKVAVHQVDHFAWRMGVVTHLLPDSDEDLQDLQGCARVRFVDGIPHIYSGPTTSRSVAEFANRF